jgi:hypothetical protein
MITYRLKCDQGHAFDSWFASAGAFDTLARTGHLTCAICGSPTVQKAIMTPRLSASQDGITTEVAQGTHTPAPASSDTSKPTLSVPSTPAERAVAELRKNVEQNCEYVGSSFAAEARAMHDGDAPARAIFGEARLDEAKKLIEEGIQIAPLPFIPKRKAN